MKKRVFFATNGGLLIIGALFFADLVWNTDAATGFLIHGAIGWRYALLLLGVLLSALPILYKRQSFAAKPLDAQSVLIGFLVLGIASVCGVVAQIFAAFQGKAGLLALLKSALLLLLAVYCAYRLLLAEKADSGLNFGVMASLFLYFLTVERFLSNASSLYRFAPIESILAALGALLFFTVLLKTMHYPPERRPYGQLMALGQLAFFLCTCIELPRTIYRFLSGSAALPAVSESLVLAAVGILGLCAAYAKAADSKRDKRVK